MEKKSLNSFYTPYARWVRLRCSRVSSTVDSSISIQRLQTFTTCASLRSSSRLLQSSSALSTRGVEEAVKGERPSELKMGVILKAYDDCRQDTLALQVMHLLEVIWESEGIDIPLMVYNVTPARTSDKNKAMGGIIECVGGWGVM